MKFKKKFIAICIGIFVVVCITAVSISACTTVDTSKSKEDNSVASNSDNQKAEEKDKAKEKEEMWWDISPEITDEVQGNIKIGDGDGRTQTRHYFKLPKGKYEMITTDTNFSGQFTFYKNLDIDGVNETLSGKDAVIISKKTGFFKSFELDEDEFVVCPNGFNSIINVRQDE